MCVVGVCVVCVWGNLGLRFRSSFHLPPSFSFFVFPETVFKNRFPRISNSMCLKSYGYRTHKKGKKWKKGKGLNMVTETPKLLSIKLSGSSHVLQLPLALVLQLRPLASDYPVHWVDS